MAGPLFLGGPTNEGAYTPDFLKWEEEGHYSRDVGSITVTPATTFQAGTVFEGPLTALVEWAGTNAITAILFQTITIPAAGTRKVTVITRDAVVDSRFLVATGRTTAQIVANMATNLSRVLVRTSA